MHEKIICAGFGGQGIMVMGKILATCAMKTGLYVTWFPSYGAEVRGGTANSSVHISTNKIASPMVLNPTSCVVMNKLSLQKFINKVGKGGLLIVNTSMVDVVPKKKDIKIIKLPLTKVAAELGNVKVANMIALGALLGLKKIVPLKDVLKEIADAFPTKKDLISINKNAIKLGYKLVGGKIK